MNLAGLTDGVFRGEAFRKALGKGSTRESQIGMAMVVADLVELGGTAVLEAGTGVGKSFAYLIPAVLSGQAAVVSTATIALQDQLLNKDIPLVSRILGRKVDAAVLKGRSNYLCLRKWNLWGGKAAPGLGEWAESGNGDLSSINLSIKPSALSRVAGDSLDCLGSRCPEMHRCHYYRARNRARKASLLIVNHHLLLCGIQSGDLIPESWLLVADEAHSLNGAASSTLGLMLSEGILNGVFDSVSLGDGSSEMKADLLADARGVSQLISKIASSGGDDGEVDLLSIRTDLQELADDSKALRKRMEDHEGLEGAAQILSSLEKTAVSIAEADPGSWCGYTSGKGKNTLFRCVPVDPGPLLRDTLYGAFPAVLLTSATLTSGGSFSYCDSMLGVPAEAERRVFPSPFDYGKNAVLVLPENIPGHNEHEAVALEAWKTAREAAELLRGRTMALFTSYRNLELCVKAAAKDPLPDLEMLVQGRMGRSAILERFRRNPEAVILGTASFWEGVDLPGEMLQALIIDRIPFPSPGHPLTRARMKAIEERGGSSFSGLMLPQAATRLKQGAGRLIRSPEDTGAVFILDGRMRTAGYAGVLLRSMPPFRRCSRDEALEFLREHAPSGEGIRGEGRLP